MAEEGNERLGDGLLKYNRLKEMSLEYAIFSGFPGPYGVNNFEDLENRVNDVISKGGKTVGGVFIDGRVPYQAVMQPVGYKYRSKGAGGRKTRKN